MSDGTKRATAATATVVLATAVNVFTGLLTERWALAWWATVIVLVIIGAGLQAWLTLSDRAGRATSVTAAGIGSIAGAGSMTDVSTEVTLSPATLTAVRPLPTPGEGVSASGIGAVTTGGDARNVHTKVTEGDPTAS
ncbi:hypothetical protein [Streptomyces sp. NBC_00310]|uniref:hypothetical protein n=1 Tax=Streptomyces sp. NBC_00310 TaxID=2903645 RepID=UPI002E226C58